MNANVATVPAMNRQECLTFMRTATSVNDWNRKRNTVKRHFTPAVNEAGKPECTYNQMMYEIDATGIIVETLGADGTYRPFAQPAPAPAAGGVTVIKVTKANHQG